MNWKKNHGRLILCMVTAARFIVCTQQWENNEIPTVEEEIVKMSEFAEMMKLFIQMLIFSV